MISYRFIGLRVTMKMLVIHVTGSNVPLVQFPIITHTVDHILVTDHVSYHSPATPPLPPPPTILIYLEICWFPMPHIPVN